MYQRLNISSKASFSEIKSAYRKRILECHPDKNGGAKEEEAKKINEAYAILSDPYKKQLYDNEYLEVDVNQDSFFEKFNTHVQDLLRVFTLMVCSYHKLHTYCSPLSVIYIEDNVYECTVKLADIYAGKTCEFPLYHNNDIIHLQVSLTNFQKEKKVKNITLQFQVIDQDYYQIYDIIHPYDISCQIEISLYEYIYGKRFTLNMFNNILHVDYTGGSPSVIIKEGYGLPFLEDNMIKRGALHIFLELVFPKDLSFVQPISETHETDKTNENINTKEEKRKRKLKAYMRVFFS